MSECNFVCVRMVVCSLAAVLLFWMFDFLHSMLDVPTVCVVRCLPACRHVCMLVCMDRSVRTGGSLGASMLQL